jgi:hypothetical protein
MSGIHRELLLEQQEQTTAALDETAVAPAPDDTPQARLLQAARAGQFEALVAEAHPAQPVAMVTPEEREAALRAEGRWSADGPAPAQEEEKEAKKKREKKEPAPEPTPNEAFIAEHCRWVPLAERRSARRPHHREGQCLTEYNVLTGEIIGDGYIHYDDEDDGR